ncbi:hypothetical protein NMG60_11012050 [Bertholletia excelsa]
MLPLKVCETRIWIQKLLNYSCFRKESIVKALGGPGKIETSLKLIEKGSRCGGICQSRRGNLASFTLKTWTWCTQKLCF